MRYRVFGVPRGRALRALRGSVKFEAWPRNFLRRFSRRPMPTQDGDRLPEHPAHDLISRNPEHDGGRACPWDGPVGMLWKRSTIKRAASPALYLEMPAVPQPMIAATGLYTPPHTITNEELVGTFNAYVQRFNADNAAAIADGSVAPLLPSSAEFIEKASGIKSRHVMDKTGILDPSIMRPIIAERPERRNFDPRRNGDRGGQGRTRALGWTRKRHRRRYLRGFQHAAALSRDGRRNSACARHRWLCLRHERRVFVGNVWHQDRRRFHFRRLGESRADGQSRDLLGPSELSPIATATSSSATSQRRSSLPMRIWQTAAGISSARASRRNSQTTSATTSDFSIAPPRKASAQRDKLFVQEGRKVYREVVPMVSEMILGTCARHRHRSAWLEAALAASGEHQHERNDRPQSLGPRAAAWRERHHSRHFRQHELCRLDHRLPHGKRRLCGRRNRAHLQLWRRLFGRHSVRRKAMRDSIGRKTSVPARSLTQGLLRD